ncbi:hypothetical protein ACFQL1_16195 [Halomicroarcula sp. GCM10025709]
MGIYATVINVSDGHAELRQERAAYKRHDQPQDEIDIQTDGMVGNGVARAPAANSSNLEAVYVYRVGPKFSGTVKIMKTRDETAYALPIAIREEGITTGTEINGQTIADSRSARTGSGCKIKLDRWVPVSVEVPVEITKLDSPLQGELCDTQQIPSEGDTVIGHLKQGSTEVRVSEFGVSIELNEPAPATGPAEVSLSNLAPMNIRGQIADDEVSAPSVGDKVTLETSRKQSEATLEAGNQRCLIELENEAILSGQATVSIVTASGGNFTGRVKRYESPSIEIGERYEAKVSKRRDTANLVRDDIEAPVVLEKGVSDTGIAYVQITEISDYFYGEVVSSVETASLDTDGHNVDMTNLSKF